MNHQELKKRIGKSDSGMLFLDDDEGTCLVEQFEALHKALGELLLAGLRGADDMRLCLLSMKGKELDQTDLGIAERFGKAREIAVKLHNEYAALLTQETHAKRNTN